MRQTCNKQGGVCTIEKKQPLYNTMSSGTWARMILLLSVNFAAFNEVQPKIRTDQYEDFAYDVGDSFNPQHLKRPSSGGSDAPFLQFRWMVMLLRKNKFACGGSLISRRHVLTAKHCVEGYHTRQLRVVLGEYRQFNYDGTEQVYAVQAVIHHPSTDASLMVLFAPVTLTAAVQTIRLAQHLPPVGVTMTTSGWGWTSSGSSSPSNTLQCINLPLADKMACNQEGLNASFHEICCGRPTGSYSNVCHGDSGSPLVFPANPFPFPYQIGIVDRGHGGCPKPYHYAVFISVPSIYSWVAEHVPDLQ